MRFNLNVSQLGAMAIKEKTGAQLDCIDLCIFDYIDGWIRSPRAHKLIHNGTEFSMVDYGNLLRECPTIPINNTRSIGRRIKQLVQCGLLSVVYNDRHAYFAAGENYDLTKSTIADDKVPYTGLQSTHIPDARVPQYRTQESHEHVTSKHVKTTCNNNNTAHEQEILDHWNDKGIIKHRSINPAIKKALTSALKNYTLEEIKKSIDTYNEILKDEKYYWTHSYPLGKFLTDGLERFIDDGAKSKHLKYSAIPVKSKQEQIMEKLYGADWKDKK